MLSTPQSEIAPTLEGYIAECDQTRASLKEARLRIAELEAMRIESTEGSFVILLPDFSIPELIAFSNAAGKKIGGILVALSGVEGDYKYVISSGSVDLRSKVKDINSTLSGRGGGRPEMIQGSFATPLSSIKEYFK